ncbi:hypothetical protein N7478_010578 [Penicillium angulare]|uniref:uncharacterized protein n=1 Tax=Penicillium angulare TaxID=116970 RepID=UPI00253F69BB|nr:uncharacterized protein N7478_010578 [Penicillium angulare]KAJ5267770.1 hypothetical protein N7478_010578 [Penicillium angulare]
MTPHNAVGWSAWEEENLLPWLESNRNLTWKALSIAYWQQYRVRRSVESLRGKKHHILRKRRDASSSSIARESKVPKCANCKCKGKPPRRRSKRRLNNLPMHQSNRNGSAKSERPFANPTLMPADYIQLGDRRE